MLTLLLLHILCSLDPKIAAQLELARLKANQVALRGGLTANSMLSGALKLGSGVMSNASRTAAELAAERLNAKLGYSKSSLLNPDSEDEGTGGSGATTSGDFVRRLVASLYLVCFYIQVHKGT